MWASFRELSKIAGKWRGNTLPESIGKILVFKKIILGLWRNDQKKLDAHGGFTPAASAPPKYDNS